MNSRQADRIIDSGAAEQSSFFDAEARAAMERAVSIAVAGHHREGHPVAVWEEGRIVMLYPDGTTQPVGE